MGDGVRNKVVKDSLLKLFLGEFLFITAPLILFLVPTCSHFIDALLFSYFLLPSFLKMKECFGGDSLCSCSGKRGR